VCRVLCSNYVFEYLDIEAREMQQMNLQLGFPAHVVHIIKPGSPLFNLSLQVRCMPCTLCSVAVVSQSRVLPALLCTWCCLNGRQPSLCALVSLAFHGSAVHVCARSWGGVSAAHLFVFTKACRAHYCLKVTEFCLHACRRLMHA
jgi:hypothetical protein